jgi:alpha-N-arabinofuranosidase
MKRLGALGGVVATGSGGRVTLSKLAGKMNVPADSDARTTTAAVDQGGASEWTLDERVFGKFLEHNGRDAYPGIYSDHVANGSFEVWNRTGPRTAVIFDVEEHPGVAYGWEPLERDGRVGFEHVPGGVHGREREPDLESGDEMAPWNWPWPPGVSESRFQRVHLAGGMVPGNGMGGVRQRTALPDRRTRTYEVGVTVRGEGVTDCAVELSRPDGTVLARQSLPVTDAWERHEVVLELDEAAGPRYRHTPFGTYDLSFVGDGQGQLDLDWVTLGAGDAVAGKFNPTTVEQLRAFEVTSIRWPGGNFASQYHWRDGVGPVSDRPVVPNCNWGGLERNYLGTNEVLEFCELVDAEPLITVGCWKHLPPSEAAAWVEYVNGDRSTEMGALRAEHGYPEPWDVTAWQVGNEVWGVYQVGHAEADRYARRYEQYATAMRDADPSIEVDATGIDPMYTDYSDGSVVDRKLGASPSWNETLFEVAGGAVEGVDVHRYSRGIKTDVARESWCVRNDVDPVEYNELLVAYPSQFGELLGELRASAADHGVTDLRVNFGEWNLQPFVSDGWPRAGYPTAAHAAYVAGMYNTFLRQGDAMRLAYQRDNTLYHRPYPVDTRPVPPGNYVQRLYAEVLADGADWRHCPVAVSGPTRSIPAMGWRIRSSDDVPYVDVAAARSDDGNRVAFAVNRDLRDAREVTVDIGSAADEVAVALLAGVDGDPFARRTRWDRVDGFEVTEWTATSDERGVSLSMPPGSVARLWLPVGGAET